MKLVKRNQLKIVIFTAVKNRCKLHGHIFVMDGFVKVQLECVTAKHDNDCHKDIVIFYKRENEYFLEFFAFLDFITGKNDDQFVRRC